LPTSGATLGVAFFLKADIVMAVFIPPKRVAYFFCRNDTEIRDEKQKYRAVV
jgi:hypothetical protein